MLHTVPEEEHSLALRLIGYLIWLVSWILISISIHILISQWFSGKPIIELTDSNLLFNSSINYLSTHQLEWATADMARLWLLNQLQLAALY
jgi:hypothetical protein